MGGMIATRLLKYNTLPVSHLIYIAQRNYSDASMLARLFTSESKRAVLKDEIKAVKIFLNIYLIKRFMHKRKTHLIWYNLLHLLKL